MIRVVRPGLLTTVQDEGRWGHQRFGIPVAGPMDRISHRLANLLVGNARSCATLEVTLVGPELEFDHDILFAVTGARFRLALDGVPVAMDSVCAAGCGQRLAFDARRGGARAYVAVAGGFDVPVVLGSRATHVGSRLGGIDGRALTTGDRLRIGRVLGGTARVGDTRHVDPPMGSGGARIRMILGPHDSRFGSEGLTTLAGSRYVVSVDSNRMGYRLSGPAVEQVTRTELLSAPVEMGAIQVPPSGEPIILMADHQTTGGYPRVGTVITADLPVVAQLAPSDWIELAVCDHEEALKAMVARERSLLS